jgi:Glyoxalase-like domain
VPIIDLAAVIVDCAAQESDVMAAFYRAACGGEIIRSDAGSAWLKVNGITVIFREVEGYQAPTWPESDVPMQIHLDFNVDDLTGAEALLQQCGATTADYQPHREQGLVIMLDPAGHPFCIGTRV